MTQEQLDQLCAKLNVLVKKLSEDVVDVRFNQGEDWSGDPSLFFRVILRDKVTPPIGDVLTKLIGYIQGNVSVALALEEHTEFCYFNFRLESENISVPFDRWE